MKIITSVSEMQSTAEALRRQGKIIGVVPTMGYLHKGHTSLMSYARRLSDILVTTIFVNPTQFAPNEDFERYPRDFERDRQLCESEGTSIIFAPSNEEMYPAGFETYVSVEGISTILEGNFRPNHFRGVATVVAKLFTVTKPHIAVFGQKDIQQLFVIRKMVKDLNLDIQIEMAPIVREPDGLAMSSRNVYLGPEDRKHATSLFRSLKFAEDKIKTGERSIEKIKEGMLAIIERENPTVIDYIAFVDTERFAELHELRSSSVIIALAVRFGSTRLIDNFIIQIQ
jgi:pantoate--beta-alanine ligase